MTEKRLVSLFRTSLGFKTAVSGTEIVNKESGTQISQSQSMINVVDRDETGVNIMLKPEGSEKQLIGQERNTEENFTK